MTMLCELIDKYVVETLLCSGGGKMSIGDIHVSGIADGFSLQFDYY